MKKKIQALPLFTKQFGRVEQFIFQIQSGPLTKSNKDQKRLYGVISL
jgi:hypothetical protein